MEQSARRSPERPRALSSAHRRLWKKKLVQLRAKSRADPGRPEEFPSKSVRFTAAAYEAKRELDLDKELRSNVFTAGPEKGVGWGGQMEQTNPWLSRTTVSALKAG